MNVTKTIVLESGRALNRSQQESTTDLWDRIALLQRDEQILLELSLKGGASIRQIGRLLGRSPGSVSRALHRLGRRLHDPLVVALLHPNCSLDPSWRQIGVERFLCRLNIAELASRHELPPTQIRWIVHLIKGWHRTTHRRGFQAGGCSR